MLCQKKTSNASKLIDKKNLMKLNNVGVEEVEKQIFDIIAEEKRNTILKQFEHFSNNPDNLNKNGMWKVLKNISNPGESSMQSAKFDHSHNLVSDPQEIKSLLSKEKGKD